MSEPNVSPQRERAADEGGLRAPPGLSGWRKAWWWFDFLVLVNLARLRFILILVAIGAVILYWDTLAAYYEKWTRPIFGEARAAASGTKFYCPMHPQVVSENSKDKCPICAMPLVKLEQQPAQGEALSAGAVYRLQLSPYKVVTAGIQTWPVNYESLSKRIQTVGFVEFDERKLRRISTLVTGRTRIDKLYVNFTGQPVHAGDPLAEVYSPDLAATVNNLRDAPDEDKRELVRQKLRRWGIANDQIKEFERSTKPIDHVAIRSPIEGHVIKKYRVEGDWVGESEPIFDVADLATVWIEAQVFADDISFLREGLRVEATTSTLPNKPLTGKLTFLSAHLDSYSRTLRVRFDIDNPEHERKPAISLRPGDWASVTIEVPAKELTEKYPSREGRVLAVPESAVIYTGSQKLVYRQHAPTVFDAVVVQLGPALTDTKKGVFYPVLKGLEAGDRVVTNGSILLDAETKVSGAAGSIYFGGFGAGKSGDTATPGVRPSTPEDEDLKVKAGLAELSALDRKLAEAQRLCPIMKTRLGAMGRPVKLILKGQPVFLCCKECEGQARADEEGTLKKVEEFKKTAAPVRLSAQEAEIKQALDLLKPDERKLAREQKICPVSDEPLGSMGKPYLIKLKEQPVLLCCKGCEEDAREDPDQTLAKVAELKRKSPK